MLPLFYWPLFLWTHRAFLTPGHLQEPLSTEGVGAHFQAGFLIEMLKLLLLHSSHFQNKRFDLAQKYLSGVTVVDDAEAVEEMFFLLDRAKVLTEPATSCTLAAAERLKKNFDETRHVVLILCGGNIGLDDLFSLRRQSEKLN